MRRSRSTIQTETSCSFRGPTKRPESTSGSPRLFHPRSDSLDARIVDLERLIPRVASLRLCLPVFREAAPFANRFFRLKEGDRDAFSVGAARAFHPQEAGLPLHHRRHSRGLFGITVVSCRAL